FGTGGSSTLGPFVATIARLLLAALVIGIPTFLMGGTLPAAVRSAGRDRVGLLYGCNTLGAVTGTVLSTFYLLERLGNRNTLLIAVGVNLAVGLVGRVASGERRGASGFSQPAVGLTAAVPRVFAAAFIVGFCFLLMELVWYRMLGPLLGGTTFTFGLILAAALFG